MSNSKSMNLFKKITKNWDSYINEQQIPSGMTTWGEIMREIFQNIDNILKSSPSLSKNVNIIKKESIKVEDSKLVFDGKRLYWYSSNSMVKSWSARSGSYRPLGMVSDTNKEGKNLGIIRRKYMLTLVYAINKFINLATKESESLNQAVGDTLVWISNMMGKSEDERTNIYGQLRFKENIPRILNMIHDAGKKKNDKHYKLARHVIKMESVFSKNIIEDLIKACFMKKIENNWEESNRLAIEAINQIQKKHGMALHAQPAEKKTKRDTQGMMHEFQHLKDKGPIPEGVYRLRHQLQEAPDDTGEVNDIYRILSIALQPAKVFPKSLINKIKSGRKPPDVAQAYINIYHHVLSGTWGNRRIKPGDVGSTPKFGTKDIGGFRSVFANYSWGKYRLKISKSKKQDERMFQRLTRKERKYIKRAYSNRHSFYIHGGDYPGTSGCIQLLGEKLSDFVNFYNVVGLNTHIGRGHDQKTFKRRNFSIPLYVKYTDRIKEKEISGPGAGNIIDRVIFNARDLEVTETPPIKK